MNVLIKLLKESEFLINIVEPFFEPLIQHYGVKTPYIDLVDK